MKIRILSWNVKGVNDFEKRKLIKAFLTSQRVDLVCLQETKLKGASTDLVRSLRVGRFVDWATVNPVGASGGILILWDSRILQLVDKEESQFSLSCSFRNCEDNSTWVFMGVYGPTTREGRTQLWEDLGAIRGLWCIGGDFNVTRFPDERNRAGRISCSMRRFL